MSDYTDKLLRHYEKSWGAVVNKIEPVGGRRDELPADFHILQFRHAVGTSVFATCGMSQPGEVSPTEIHTILDDQPPVSAFTVSQALAAVAHYHRTACSIQSGDTINLGEALLAGSQCLFALLSLPYLDGPDLKWVSDSSPAVRCLWMVPITHAEREYVKRCGFEALEDLFESRDVNYSNLLRASLI